MRHTTKTPPPHVAVSQIMNHPPEIPTRHARVTYTHKMPHVPRQCMSRSHTCSTWLKFQPPPGTDRAGGGLSLPHTCITWLRFQPRPSTGRAGERLGRAADLRQRRGGPPLVPKLRLRPARRSETPTVAGSLQSRLPTRAHFPASAHSPSH